MQLVNVSRLTHNINIWEHWSQRSHLSHTQASYTFPTLRAWSTLNSTRGFFFYKQKLDSWIQSQYNILLLCLLSLITPFPLYSPLASTRPIQPFYYHICLKICSTSRYQAKSPPYPHLPLCESNTITVWYSVLQRWVLTFLQFNGALKSWRW